MSKKKKPTITALEKKLVLTGELNIGETKLYIQRLKKKLWPIFSEYQRIRYSNKNGFVKCVTCDAVYKYKGEGKVGAMQCGHFFPQKAATNLIFEEINTGPQCASCNGPMGQGQQYFYSKKIKKVYGQEKLDELEKKYHDYRKWKKDNPKKQYKWDMKKLINKIEYYTEQLKIEKEKRKL